jgi:hypothetical protein
MSDVTKIESMITKKTQSQLDGGQNYDLIAIMWECLGCGAMVSNTPQHDRMHNKTRSIVD